MALEGINLHFFFKEPQHQTRPQRRMRQGLGQPDSVGWWGGDFTMKTVGNLTGLWGKYQFTLWLFVT
jgi:hypothetical protein